MGAGQGVKPKAVADLPPLRLCNKQCTLLPLRTQLSLLQEDFPDWANAPQPGLLACTSPLS